MYTDKNQERVDLEKLEEMTASEIFSEAIRRGYETMERRTGKRLMSGLCNGNIDQWMNAANRRLRKLQIEEELRNAI